MGSARVRDDAGGGVPRGGGVSRGAAGGRPPVSVVVPFSGDTRDVRALAAALAALKTRSGDEVVVADNTVGGTFSATVRGGQLRTVAAPLERSSYYARNIGVESSTNDWLLFLDSNCRPEPGLLDAFFAPPPGDDVGIVSGAVVSVAGLRKLVARYAASRHHIDREVYAAREGRRPAGTTANLLVRRAAWEAVHGFHEGVRSGADLELCWRVQDAGWCFDRRPAARVERDHVRTLAALRRRTIRHAGGGGWVKRHHPGAFRRPAVGRRLARSAAGVVVWTAALRPRRALFKGIDALFLLFDGYGRLIGNRAPRDPARRVPQPLVVVADCWADATDSEAAAAVRRLAARGARSVVVEGLRRPQRPDRQVRR